MTAITPVNVWTSPNDNTGDLWRDGFIKINTNINNLNTDKLEAADIANKQDILAEWAFVDWDKTNLDNQSGVNTWDQDLNSLVTWPASAVDSNFASYDTTTGKLLKDSLSKASDFEAVANKDTTWGYTWLTLFKINFKNALNTFTSFFTNANTAARTYTFPNKDGIVAMTSDITWTNSWTNTWDVTLSGTTNYITIVWQVITRALINLTTHVTWTLPVANWGTGVTTSTGTWDTVRNTSPVINTPTGIVKSDVGLANVDNTSDANKPVSSAQQTEIDTKEDKTTTINVQTGTTYTLLLSDQSKLVILTNAAAITLTIPTNASVAFPVWTQIDLSQDGAGAVTISWAGVTINSLWGLLTSNGQYVWLTLIKVWTDEWNVYWNLV